MTSVAGVRRNRWAGWAAVVLVGVAFATAGCAQERPAIVALKSLPRLVEYPEGYSMPSKPESISADQPGTAVPLTFTDDSCRSLIENPVGAGAKESVTSGTNPAVFLVQIVESELSVAELTTLAQRCADVEARTGTGSTLRMAVTATDPPKTGAAESVAIRTTGTQETRIGDAPPTRTQIGQQRYVARVGKYVVSALAILPPMPEQGLAAEIGVLGHVYRIAVDRLVNETR
ncbi:hypothetical protein ACFYO7_12480 [Nocardia salmonicida]|uniref:hypothetical protein n=1 Tax=Nocardia salmonicida TaxID=53431 RepID=UPI00367CD757